MANKVYIGFYYNSFLLNRENNPTAISNGRYQVAATHVGDYALFAGGAYTDHTTGSNIVEAYNTSLTKSNCTGLTNSVRTDLSATHVGDYALFAAGGSSATTFINAYNKSLTRSTPTALAASVRQPGATHVGNYALIGGGIDSSQAAGARDIKTVNVYDSSLTRSLASDLYPGRSRIGATHVGNYAIFAGGYQDYDKVDGGGNSIHGSARVDAYDTSLTKSTPSNLSSRDFTIKVAHNNNYALIAMCNENNLMDAYDTSLTKSAISPLSVQRSSACGNNIGDCAMFAGGGSNLKVIDAYDSELTRFNTAELSDNSALPSGTHVGNYAIFNGIGSKRDVANAFSLTVKRGGYARQII